MKLSVPLAGSLFALGALGGGDGHGKDGCNAHKKRLRPDKVAADIKTADLKSTLEDLYEVAQANGGNRAFGLPGYQASVDYVVDRLSRHSKDVDVSVQPFTHTFEQTREISVKGPDGEEVYAITLLYNPATPEGGITAPLIDTPVNDEIGSGCTEELWEGIDATGKLALVKRGLCDLSSKLKLARAHGALGVILYNQTPGTNYSSATLGAENRFDIVPTAVIPLEVGTEWSARLAAGEEVSVSLLVDSIFEERETWNVIAETKEGDPNNVVFLGAHLDSVQAGPGINDDGSGTAGLLVFLDSLVKYKGIKNKVRFGWWGAEESGLVGSTYYTSQLSPEEADKHRYYFNYDMIGSPNPSYVVYEGEAIGSEKLFSYIDKAGKPAEFGAFGSSSDYVGFLDLGIPSSGLFTGAGAPEDACYHLACDDLDNISWEAITLNTKAAAHVAAEFALSLEGIPARNSSTTTAKRAEVDLRSWDSVIAQVEAAKPCSHDHDHDSRV
ncbi:related to aminopeptidase Y precursor, vacuolar [Cephalotrichum gorgonifer]|uniref:Peptide hydrolase n=1 Tax=Cephalotrichum gorgonifer TaxID=2041049 RepID=A0AAE8SVP6_9PEZI|nr:related to aminopeptidase Y precursor, vacuolar [Cephalotrichum gorgonifer]